MVYRIYVGKKKEFALDAEKLKNELVTLLGITGLKTLRVINRYDAENIGAELFSYAVKTVFSEPQVDETFDILPINKGETAFAVEYLPGQFDQRAESAAECVQLISATEKPLVKTAKIYILGGKLTAKDISDIKKYVINPVEAREADMKEYATLKETYAVPTSVETLDGFIDLNKDGLELFVKKYALAMDGADAAFCREYFKKENRNPTLTEIRMLDTYWSDHCRHTTFLTTIDKVEFLDKNAGKAYEDYLSTRKSLNRTKPVNLMDVATVGAKYLKKEGALEKLDVSEEINACTVKIKVDHDGKKEDWLLLFKNETHNHPTEIEPFGGAATCIGGAIRDPLSGRSYVYAAMRVTGAGNPLTPVNETVKGKLPQRKIVTTAANGYSSYGNQIGLCTGLVNEIYHEGYVAKRMEIGAVIGATPEKNVRREKPEKGDIVILLGGRTGRDGCGGATGSSKSHNAESLVKCGAEVQKGNAPEERKLQRLFRNADAVRLVKRCNDFGAGGVSVAVGELADGLIINLNAVPKKYEGLDGTELAISESQERMAVVVAENDARKFIGYAESENLEATVVAEVTDDNRLVMEWNGKKIVDISREFLDTSGAEKHTVAVVGKGGDFGKTVHGGFCENYKNLVNNLNVCSQRGLSERFDSTIGAGTVLMPFGGKYQNTPIQAMCHTVSVEKGHTETCSVMAYGYNPYITEKNEYCGAYLAVVESIAKLVAAGAEDKDVYLTFQEYFAKPGNDAKKWGSPLSALLGAFEAQKDYRAAAVGGKDSMSGTFEKLTVPPTLVSFAVTTSDVDSIISPEFKKSGSKVYLLKPEYDENGLPVPESEKALFDTVARLNSEKKLLSVYTPVYGGVAEAVFKMAIGNMLGFRFEKNINIGELFGYMYGAFVVESEESVGVPLGETTDSDEISYGGERVKLSELFDVYENKLESVFPTKVGNKKETPQNYSFERKGETQKCPTLLRVKPKVLIPVFPGTNCEYDTAKAFEDAGAETEIFVVNNLSSDNVRRSSELFAEKVGSSQIIFIPGGFSGGDEPDGSGKFITAFFRNAEIKDAVSGLLDVRKGLAGGICNGFQALIKLGLVPYGKIVDSDENSPTLTFNDIGRHRSGLVRLRVASNKSPWAKYLEIGDVYNAPVSHGEGKFVCKKELLSGLAANGQILTQYADFDGNASYDIRFNPNGSFGAVEGITSPDGRVFGKMGHSERIGYGLYKNVMGKTDMKLFKAGVEYFI
jgi:phosphoribosylformylglycinamidine synthase